MFEKANNLNKIFENEQNEYLTNIYSGYNGNMIVTCKKMKKKNIFI